MTDTNFQLPKNALQELPTDENDFKLLGGTFQVPKLTDIPDEFFDAELMGIKNQTDFDFCAGFTAAEVSEDQEAVELDPFFIFAMAKKLLGGDSWKAWGLNLRDVAEAGVKIGFIEASQNPFIHDDRITDRDFLANPANWPDELLLLAEDHKKGSYWDAITGPYDKFDNLRAALWMNRFEHRSIITGALFRDEWRSPENGILSSEYGTRGEGHAFKVFGWKLIEGITYLVAVNSWGPDFGDGGLFYISREIVNKEFTYGAYTFKDMEAEDAHIYIDNNISPSDPPGTKLWKIFLTWLRAFFTHK